jgi:hypothetical protein
MRLRRARESRLGVCLNFSWVSEEVWRVVSDDGGSVLCELVGGLCDLPSHTSRHGRILAQRHKATKARRRALSPQTRSCERGYLRGRICNDVASLLDGSLSSTFLRTWLRGCTEVRKCLTDFRNSSYFVQPPALVSRWADGYHCVLGLSYSVGCRSGSGADDPEGVELLLLRRGRFHRPGTFLQTSLRLRAALAFLRTQLRDRLAADGSCASVEAMIVPLGKAVP